MSIAAIQPIDMIVAASIERAAIAKPAEAVRSVSFSDMLVNGTQNTVTKLAEADHLVREAALDSSIPLHRVTYALEEARISLELFIQIRNRLVDASQQLMNMQL